MGEWVPEVVLFAIAASLVYLAVAAGTVLLAALRYGGRRETPSEDHQTLAVSRFTIPVSLIVVADAAKSDIGRALHALLGLNYPEVEVIAVVEGIDDTAFDTLKGQWRLEAREVFYRRTLPTANVSRLYRSAADPRLLVVTKDAAGRADAINCGVNIAKYRYVGVLDTAIRFDSDALLRVMSAAQRDPGAVVGVSAHVEPRETSQRLLTTVARLASMREIMDTRLAWQRMTGALGPARSVIVWRRDAVLSAGGFSTTAANPDVDMMVRLQTSTAAGASGRVVRSADVFGGFDHGPTSDALRGAAARQRAAFESVWTWLRQPGRHLLSGRAWLYFVLSEFVTPLAQTIVVMGTIGGAAMGWLPWWHVAATVVVLSLGTAIVSNSALLMRGITPGAPEGRDLRRLLLAAPFEFVLVRPAMAFARVMGVVRA